MFISLSGLLKRLKGLEYQMYAVDKFLKHFAEAKEAQKNGNKETVDRFFNLYVTWHEMNP